MHPRALLLLWPLSFASAAQAAPPPVHAAPGSHGSSHWMGASPHLPLAVTADGTLTGPTKTEGCAKAASWAAKGRVYQILDRWGRVEGTTHVVRRERNAVSGCDEVVFAGPQGADGDALLVSSDSAWRPRAARHPGQETFEDHPAGPVTKSFATFLEGLDARVVHGGVAQDGVFSTVAGAGAAGRSRAADRVAYFVSDPATTDGAKPEHLAVAVGTYVVIARYEPKSGWRAVYLSHPLPSSADAYDAWTLLSTVDMDEDGVPEVVLHGAQDTEYWDLVVSHTYEGWNVVARSAGGSTI